MNPNRERSRSREKVPIYRQESTQVKKSEERQIQRGQSNERKAERKSPSAQREFSQGYMQYPSSSQAYSLQANQAFIQGPMGGQQGGMGQGLVQPGVNQGYGQGVKPNTAMSQGVLNKPVQYQHQQVGGQALYYGTGTSTPSHFPNPVPQPPKPTQKAPSSKPQPLTFSQLSPQSLQQLANFLRQSKKPFPSQESSSLLGLLQKLSTKYPFEAIYQVFLYFFVHCSVLDEGVYKVFYWLISRREEDLGRFYDILVKTTIKSAFEEWKAAGVNVIATNNVQLAHYYRIQPQTRQKIMNRPLYSNDKQTTSMTTLRNVLTLVRKAIERQKILQKSSQVSHPIRQILKVVRQITKSILKKLFLKQTSAEIKQPKLNVQLQQQQQTLQLLIITQLYLSIYPKYKHYASLQLQQTLNQLTILKMKLAEKQSQQQSHKLQEQHKVVYLYLMWVAGLAVYGRGQSEERDEAMLAVCVGVMVEEYRKSGEFLVEKLVENQGKVERRDYFGKVRKNFGVIEQGQEDRVTQFYREMVYGVWREVVGGVLLMELRGNSDDKLNTTSPHNNNNNSNNNNNNLNNNKKPSISWVQLFTCLHPTSSSCQQMTNHLSLKTRTRELLFALDNNCPSQHQSSLSHKLTTSNHVIVEFELLFQKSLEELGRMLGEEKARVGQRGDKTGQQKSVRGSGGWSERDRVRLDRWMQRLRNITSGDTQTLTKLLILAYLSVKLSKFSLINNSSSFQQYNPISALNSIQLQLISHFTCRFNIQLLTDVMAVVKQGNERLLIKRGELYEWEEQQGRVMEKILRRRVGGGEGQNKRGKQREDSCSDDVAIVGDSQIIRKELITPMITTLQSYIQTSTQLSNQHQTSLIHQTLHNKKLSLLQSSVRTHLQQFILQIKSCHQTTPIRAQTLIEMLLLEVFRLYVGLGEKKGEKGQLNLIEGGVTAVVRARLGLKRGDGGQQRKAEIGMVEDMFGQVLKVIYNGLSQIDQESSRYYNGQHNTSHPTPLIQLLIAKLKKCISLHYDKLNELSLTHFILHRNLFILRCLAITFYKIKSLTETLCDGFGLFEDRALNNQRDGEILQLTRKVFFMIKGDALLEAVVRIIKNRDKRLARQMLGKVGSEFYCNLSAVCD